MSKGPHINFQIGLPQGKTTFGHKDGKPIIYIGWLFTGDRHPAEVRATGGDVTGFPKKDGRPLDAGTLWRAWQVNERDDHVYVFTTKFGLTGWFSSVYVRVNVDKAVAEILAAAEIPDQVATE
jgi:hypothetical protein